jgi:hypothetical protein
MNHTSTGLRYGATATAAALVATGVLALTGNAVAADGPAADRHLHVLQFGVTFSPHHVVDVPPLAEQLGDYGPGDYATFGDVLTDDTGRRVGTEAGSGLITKVSPTGAQIFFSMAIHLRRGDITAAGIGSTDPHKSLVVTGGTGSFLGARGAVHLVEFRHGTGTLEIVLR